MVETHADTLVKDKHRAEKHAELFNRGALHRQIVNRKATGTLHQKYAYSCVESGKKEVCCRSDTARLTSPAYSQATQNMPIQAAMYFSTHISVASILLFMESRGSPEFASEMHS